MGASRHCFELELGLERYKGHVCANAYQQPVDLLFGDLQLDVERFVLHGEGGELALPFHLVLLVVELLRLEERAQLPQVARRFLHFMLAHGNLLSQHGLRRHLLSHYAIHQE